MPWLLRKIDSLAGAFFAATGGIACAQLPVFVQQYLQRLGGHVDEARRLLAGISGQQDTFGIVDAPAWPAFEALARARLLALEAQQSNLYEISPLLRPLEFLRTVDTAIAVATFERFVPAVPLDIAGLAYGIAGIFCAWLAFEGLKIPFLVLGRIVAGYRRRTGQQRVERDQAEV